MIRLDKFLATMGLGSRSQVKDLIKQGKVTINGQLVRKVDFSVNEKQDHVYVLGKEVHFSQHFYYMLNKPAGIVSAVTDKKETTVIDLFKDAPGKCLFPVGRLDKDTEGLLLVTNDGELSHALLSPARHVPKTYLVKTTHPFTLSMKQRLESGVDIGDQDPARPAIVEQIGDKFIRLTITEGRFHQVKRMLKAVNNEVLYLKRLSMGSLQLDESLCPGTYRPLTQTELDELLPYLSNKNKQILSHHHE